MAYATMQPTRRSGQFSTPSQKAFATAAAFNKGVPVSLALGSGLTPATTIQEFSGVRAANRTTGRVAGISEQAVSATGGITSSTTGGFPNIDLTYVPALPGLTFRGSLDDGTKTRLLANTDAGKTFGMTKDAPSGNWFLDSTKTTDGASSVPGTTVALVLALIDPVGATAGDTPSPTNSGSALVEFTFLPEATSYSGV